MKLSIALQNRIISFLVTLPNIGDSQNRRALIESAGLDTALQGQIRFEEASIQFFQLLVPNLLQYGKLEDGRESLFAVLDAAKMYVGQERQEDCENLLNELRTSWQKHTQKREPPLYLPFVNREAEIKQIFHQYASPALYIVDAPAGYGKTSFLLELQRRFGDDGWFCLYQQVEQFSSTTTVLKNMLSKIGIRGGNDIEESVERLTHKLVNGIMQQNFGVESKQGITLLFDLDRNPSLPILQILMSKIIPIIEEELRHRLKFFTTGSRFRVVIAGRHIAKIAQENNSLIRFSCIQLAPFDYHVVRDSVKIYYANPDITDAAIQNIAAHLLKITGGHPGCIAKILASYQQDLFSLSRFVDDYQQELWEQIVSESIQNIWEDIESEYRQFLSPLSVFRYIDAEALSDFFGINEEDMWELIDGLTTTYLCEWRQYSLHDGITRQMLSIRLRVKDRAKFVDLCKKAQSICLQRIEGNNAKFPAKWVVEYWYQVLQEKTLEGGVEQSFFDEYIHPVLCTLVESREDRKKWREEYEALKEVLREDKDFEFHVNYSLSNGHYTGEPFRQLNATITDFFQKVIRSR